jgi:ABC-2 type transport system ATP-binding protein
MLQEGGIDPRATPLEALRLYGRLHADPRPAPELIEVVGLGGVAGTRYRRLSGGERQRLGLALALVGRPEVLFLDEPTAGMDPEARVATRALLLDLRSSGTAILLTTHDLGDVERIADRVVVLDGGHVVAEGRPGELGADSAGQIRVRLSSPVAPPDVETLSARLGLPVSPLSSDPATLLVPDTASSALIVLVAQWAADAGLLIVELRSGTSSLEERYLALTRDAGRRPGSNR